MLVAIINFSDKTSATRQLVSYVKVNVLPECQTKKLKTTLLRVTELCIGASKLVFRLVTLFLPATLLLIRLIPEWLDRRKYLLAISLFI